MARGGLTDKVAFGQNMEVRAPTPHSSTLSSPTSHKFSEDLWTTLNPRLFLFGICIFGWGKVTAVAKVPFNVLGLGVTLTQRDLTALNKMLVPCVKALNRVSDTQAIHRQKIGKFLLKRQPTGHQWLTPLILVLGRLRSGRL
jgi:hypothetical protein